jgi:hypothetical protein
MMLLTSSPLPMPAELIEPVVVLEVVVMDFLAVENYRFARACVAARRSNGPCSDYSAVSMAS